MKTVRTTITTGVYGHPLGRRSGSLSKRIDDLAHLKPSWDSRNARQNNMATRKFAKAIAKSGVVNESWEVGPHPDGSILFTDRKQTKKIMVAAV